MATDKVKGGWGASTYWPNARGERWRGLDDELKARGR